MENKKYRVRFQCDDGEVICREYSTLDQAQELYDGLDGHAEIQQYNEALGDYEIVVYSTFEY